MPAVFLKIGVVGESDINEFSESLRDFMHRMMPGCCRGDRPPNCFRKVWYMEVMSNSESGYTIFLQTWRDPVNSLKSCVDDFFKIKHPRLQCEKVYRWM